MLALNLVIQINLIDRLTFLKNLKARKVKCAERWELYYYPSRSMKFSKVMAFIRSFRVQNSANVRFDFFYNILLRKCQRIVLKLYQKKK